MNNNFTISQKKKEFLEDTKPLYYIEVTPSGKSLTEFDYIVFKNFYTHTINIVQYSNEKWKCILGEYKLMIDPDCDEDAEKYFVIYKKQLEENGLSEDAKLLRFYLTQESAYWKNFTLNEIKFTSENNIQTSNEGIKYNMNNMRFEFGNSVTILNDKEEINQKFIEIMKINNREDLILTIFK